MIKRWGEQALSILGVTQQEWRHFTEILGDDNRSVRSGSPRTDYSLSVTTKYLLLIGRYIVWGSETDDRDEWVGGIV